MEFQIGDKAVYPAQGVAEIVGIEDKEIGSEVYPFYILKLLDTEKQTLLVPRDKASQVGLRPVVSDDEIGEVFEILKEEGVFFDKQTWNRRFRDLYRLRTSKNLSFGERRMFERAKDLVVKEISVSQNWTASETELQLEKAFDA